MNTSNFSTRRVFNYAKSEILSQQRMWLLWWGTIGFIMVVFYGFNAFMGSLSVNDGTLESNELQGVRSAISTISTLVSVILVSGAFGGYLKPRSASQLMLLPISKAERFTFLAVFYVVAIPLILFITQFVMDLGFSIYYGEPNLLEVMFSGIFQGDAPGYVDGDVSPSRVMALGMLMGMLGKMLLLSAFFYGGILFRRNNFVMTCLVLFGLSVISSFVALLAVTTSTRNGSVSFMSIDGFWGQDGIVATSIAVIFSAALLVLAYRRFCNFQIIK